MNDFSADGQRGRIQFSLRSLLLITTGVGAFIWLILALDPFQLLDMIWLDSADWWYAFACLSLASVGFCMMIVSIVRARGRHSWAVCLLVAGIGYAAANVCVFNVTMSHDPFAIFERTYTLLNCFCRTRTHDGSAGYRG